MTGEVHVTSFKLLSKKIQDDLKLTENRKFENYIYIGRQNNRLGLQASPLANPFKPKNKDIESKMQCIAFYHSYITGDDMGTDVAAIKSEFKRLKDLLAIHGEIFFVCFCKRKIDGKTPCHGDRIRDIIRDRLSGYVE